MSLLSQHRWKADLSLNMKSDWSWSLQLKLWWYDTVFQLTGSEKYWKKKSSLGELKAHILLERKKMSRKLWLKIMFRDKWECQIHHHPVCLFQASQVDHVVALFNKGKTTESNLQAACEPCNKWKGKKLIY